MINQALFSMIIILSLFITSLVIAEEPKKELNVYNWSDYIAPNTVKNFEKETGIKVNYDVFDSDHLLESKLLSGNSGYDLVFPSSSPFLTRQKKLGIYQKIDKSKLKNYANLDKFIMKKLAEHDEDNEYSVPYMWGTVGIGYNIDKLNKIFPGLKIDSWSNFFDPKYAKELASCGMALLDSPNDIVPNVLLYLGIIPNMKDKESLAKAEEALIKVRPYVKMIHSSKYIDAIANDEICIAIGYSGDFFQAIERAKEAQNGVKIQYVIPKEGTQIWIDVMAITADAKNVENAHKFIDYILKPEVVGDITNYVGYANGNEASNKYIKKEILNNPLIYPKQDVFDHFYTVSPASPQYERLRTRSWSRFLSGS